MAFERETKEELGDGFWSNCINEIEIFGSGRIDFPTETFNVKELKNDSGEKLIMKGKKYFFIACQVKDEKLLIAESEFDEYKWAAYDQALLLTANIYQKGKKRITLQILKRLKDLNLL